MRLLVAHKILVSAALALALILVAWGVVHGAQRGERQGWAAMGIGLVAAPLCALYLRKLFRNPPIK